MYHSSLTRSISQNGFYGFEEVLPRLMKDHLGSTRAVFDDNGQIVEARDYYPFGLEMPGRTHTGGTGEETKEKFTGKERDWESGMHYFSARYYDASIGRFLSVDPLDIYSPSKSPFHYCSNNPINRVDPTGMVDENAGGENDEVFTIYGRRYGRFEWMWDNVYSPENGGNFDSGTPNFKRNQGLGISYSYTAGVGWTNNKGFNNTLTRKEANKHVNLFYAMATTLLGAGSQLAVNSQNPTLLMQMGKILGTTGAKNFIRFAKSGYVLTALVYGIQTAAAIDKYGLGEFYKTREFLRNTTIVGGYVLGGIGGALGATSLGFPGAGTVVGAMGGGILVGETSGLIFDYFWEE